MAFMENEMAVLARTLRRFAGHNSMTNEPGNQLLGHLLALDTVRAEVERHVIDPNPENYTLLYRYFVNDEVNLKDAVDQLIASGYAPLLGTDDPITQSEDNLITIADKAQAQLQSFESLISNSQKDAQGFGKALEGSVEKIQQERSGGDVALKGLISLTRKMIEKTRAAEKEMRDQSKKMASLKDSLSDARIKADTDVLTGLSNRRAFERALGAATARAEISRTSFTLAICDVDHFKVINDNFGHDTGDRVLKLISKIIEDHCAKAGQVFRFGGEEFVILFEGLSASRAFDVVDAARIDLANRHIIKMETHEPLGQLSFSAGIASFEANLNSGMLLRIADKALYSAKENGRNRICFG